MYETDEPVLIGHLRRARIDTIAERAVNRMRTTGWESRHALWVDEAGRCFVMPPDDPMISSDGWVGTYRLIDLPFPALHKMKGLIHIDLHEYCMQEGIPVRE